MIQTGDKKEKFKQFKCSSENISSIPEEIKLK